MIWILLFILTKIYGREKVLARLLQMRSLIPKRRLLLTVAHTSAFLLAGMSLNAQEVKYKVVQNDRQIGWIELKKSDTGSTSWIELQSEIRKRVVFAICVTEKQHVQFKEGVMMKSYIYRRVNDDVKINQHTSFAGNHYEVNNSNTPGRISITRIGYNQLSLYFKEPVNIRQVYSDNYQRFLPIIKTGDASYKLEMPDGNCNTYYYTNGLCSRVVVRHSLFTVEFIRINNPTLTAIP